MLNPVCLWHWTVAHKAPLSREFPNQEYWSRLSFPYPGDLPDPGIEPRCFLTSEPPTLRVWTQIWLIASPGLSAPGVFTLDCFTLTPPCWQHPDNRGVINPSYRGRNMSPQRGDMRVSLGKLPYSPMSWNGPSGCPIPQHSRKKSLNDPLWELTAPGAAQRTRVETSRQSWLVLQALIFGSYSTPIPTSSQSYKIFP